MSAIDTNKIVSASQFSGFKNYQNATFSASYAGGNILAGAYVGPVSASTALNNTNSVSQVQVQFTGLETFYRLIPGTTAIDYPSAAAANYQIEVIIYFTGGNLFVDSYIINQTGGTVTVPAITFSCRAFLYNAPF